MDNLGFITSRYSIKELAKTLGQIIITILDSGKSNAVTYDIAKIEIAVFSKSHYQQLNKQIAEINIKIEPEKIKFNKDTMR